MTESVLAVRGLGVQLTTKYASGAVRHKFIDHSLLRDIIINEGFTMFRVIFYLAFQVKGESKLILPFQVNASVGEGLL